MNNDKDKTGVPPRPADSHDLPHLPRCMVAMPFKEGWSDAVYKAIEQVMQSVRIDIFKVDTTKRKAAKLSDDVESQIRDVDMIVADVTGQNANVHVEIGLALACNKELVLCTQHHSDLCADLRDRLYIRYTPDEAGLQELIRELRLRMGEALERARLERETRRLKQELMPIYSVECYRDRSTANLGKAFSSARNHIDILTTNLGWLFKKDDPTHESDWDCILRAIQKNPSLQLRILTLDPHSEIAAQRAAQLGFAASNFRSQLQESFDLVRAVVREYPKQVESRLYNELPTQITFRIDEDVYTCIVGQPMQSRDYPVLKFNVVNLGVKEACLSHFLAVWKGAIRGARS